eukprot:TRINITY_DN13394_c0_g1_i1.p1 TRINITY_DN13394_c0_g1~~TRINITY_DN13394_c0_g1_i1.p1  ORF type:complete len:364 (-),score=69.96 TRINITY_DN13394_c0_g1_i1:96-1187(-)
MRLRPRSVWLQPQTWRFGSHSAGLARSRRFATANSKDEEARIPLYETKVSPRGTSDALFQECLDKIRQKKAKHQADSYRSLTVDSKEITQLKEEELELTRKIFKRIDPAGDMTSDHAHAEHHIDPYWNPFHKVRDLQDKVVAEFDEYARCVNVAEQKRIRIQIRKSLRRVPLAYNPYTSAFAGYHGRKTSVDEPPKPFRISDKHWERTPLQERLSRERITWRDVDIIQHFVADNGYILPRRTTMLDRRQQSRLVKAVKTAQRMSLIPYNWRLPDFQAMPLMDPLQWMVERLTDRVVEARDRRSRAMLQVMIGRYPELNFARFLRHEAATEAQEAERGSPDGAASFSSTSASTATSGARATQAA